MGQQLYLIPFFAASSLLFAACARESATDKNCEQARQMYQELREQAENPDLDGDGVVSVSEQVVFDGTKQTRRDNLADFVDGWYEVGGCSLDSDADSTSAESTLIETEGETRLTEAMVTMKVNGIARITGMTETEVIALVQKMNVNLGDATVTFKEQLGELGLLMSKTQEQLDQAFAETLVNNVNRYFGRGTIIDETLTLNDSAEKLSQEIGASGRMASAYEQRILFRAYTEELSNYYEGDTSKAYFEMKRQIGKEDAIAFATPRHPLYGMGKSFYSEVAGQRSREFLNQTESDLVNTVIAPQLAAVMAKGGLGFSSPDQMNTVKKTFKNMSVDDQERFTNVLSSGSFDQYGGNPIAFLQDLGVPGIGTATGQGLKDLSDYDKSLPVP